jgi:hypothetical protein
MFEAISQLIDLIVAYLAFAQSITSARHLLSLRLSGLAGQRFVLAP